MRSISVCSVVAIALVSFAPRASAAPITYEISGVASGTIGGKTFTNALVVFTGHGDTAGVISDTFMGNTFYAAAFMTASVNIAGIGTATLLDPSEILGIPQTIIDPELPPFPLVLFGRTDNPPDLDSLTGMAATASNLLAGYDLKTAIGPITSLGGVGFIDNCGTPGHDPCLSTSMGLLSFTGNILETGDGTGTFRATLDPVPEPASILLMSGGLGALVRRARRRSRD